MNKTVCGVVTALLLSGCASPEVRRFMSGNEYDPRTYSAEMRERDRKAAEQAARERDAEAAKQKENDRIAAYDKFMERDELRKQLISGSRPVSTLEDAIILHSPKVGTEIVMSPKVGGGDGEYYKIHFTITDRQGDDYIAWDPHFGVGAIAENPEIFGDARYNGPMVLVGRYSGNSRVRLVSGKMVTIPKFDNAMLFAK